MRIMKAMTTMTGSKRQNIQELYLRWLESFVVASDYKGKSYEKLCNLLMKLPFISSPEIPLDENRKCDVQSLLRETYIQSQSEWYRLETDEVLEFPKMPVTFLELIISLAMRIDMDFMREINDVDNSRVYFWVIINNLGFLKYDDDSWTEDSIIEIVNRVNIVQERKYDFNGNGGLFPLKRAEVDQRTVQIWNQLCTFVDEKFMKL